MLPECCLLSGLTAKFIKFHYKAGALRNGDILLSVRSFVCRQKLSDIYVTFVMQLWLL